MAETSDANSSCWGFLTVAAASVVAAGSFFYLRPKSNNKSQAPVLKSDNEKKQVEPAKDEATNFECGDLLIYFGSQTGTAEGFARTLAKEAKENGFRAEVVDLENFEADKFVQPAHVMLVVATYGEGDPTDNAVKFTKWLKDEAAEGVLSGVKYCVFGLGNRQYEHYNAMGKLVDKRMEELGAHRTVPRGEGDDDGTLEEDFCTWKDTVWPALRSQFAPKGAPTRRQSMNETVEWPFELAQVSSLHQPSSIASLEYKETAVKLLAHAKTVTLSARKELRQCTKDGSSIHVELELDPTIDSYRTADNLSICPENRDEVVERIAARLSLDRSQMFDLKIKKGCESQAHEQGLPFPCPFSVETALRRYVDVDGLPRKAILRDLAHYCSDKGERERLQHLSSQQGKDEYQSFITDYKRSLLEVIEYFSSIRMTLLEFLLVMPRIQPRYYTIASSAQVHRRTLHLTLGVIQDKLPDNRVRPGLCSSYIARVPVGEKLRVNLHESTFRLPPPCTPIVMVGPGTGIAPFRAFWQERAIQTATGETVLYFGCRRKDADWLYQDEMLHAESNKHLSHLNLAFSRMGDEKIYVQHLLERNAEQTYKLIQDGAYIYTCGSNSMGRDVVKAVETIFVKCGHVDVETAKARVKQLQQDGRFIQELWG